ncbi:hypothetical protein D3H35_20260 [Cohnella faecalis]|uniref:Uncharacterized protein n=1 Tax=Cohnella faecalis TaxID=2315694 RepID=A0A398CL60_9BACL|nr:hypothetical protein D3H35_20260 [Cohnella faecalis]
MGVISRLHHGLIFRIFLRVGVRSSGVVIFVFRFPALKSLRVGSFIRFHLLVLDELPRGIPGHVRRPDVKIPSSAAFGRQSACRRLDIIRLVVDHAKRHVIARIQSVSGLLGSQGKPLDRSEVVLFLAGKRILRIPAPSVVDEPHFRRSSRSRSGHIVRTIDSFARPRGYALIRVERRNFKRRIVGVDCDFAVFGVCVAGDACRGISEPDLWKRVVDG